MIKSNLPMLTQDQAAELLGLSNPKTLAAWRLRRQGPPYFRVQTSIRYRKEDIDQWLERSRVDPAAVIERVSND